MTERRRNSQRPLWLWSLVGWCAALAFLAAGLATAATPITEVRQRVKTTLEAHYQGLENTRVDIAVATLDTRLRLAECGQALTVELDDDERRGGRVNSKVRCPGPATWSLYVPATVSLYRPVAVADRDLIRNQVLTEDDVRWEERDVTVPGKQYLSSAEALTGMALRRPLRAGEPLLAFLLEQPVVVQRGDAVMITASAGTIAVSAQGTALASGRVGDQVRVRNTRSERIIRARVIGPGRVAITL